MKTILLSIKPYWYERIKAGQKIFEYRKRFCSEPVKAYLYISKPIKAVTGIIQLAPRIELAKWKEQFINDTEAVKRIEEFKLRNRYAMPILSFQDTNRISLYGIQEKFSSFLAPQMYYNLDGTKILDFLDESLVLKGEKIMHNFDEILSSQVCQK